MKKFYILFIFASIAVGLIYPQGERIKFLLPYFLAASIFLNFYSIDISVRKFFRIEILYYFVITLILAPTIIFFLTSGLDINLRLGFVLIAITPVAISSSIVVKIIDGDMELSLTNILFFNLFSIISYPLLIKIFFYKDAVEVPFKNILANLFFIILIPYILSIIFKKSGILKKTISAACKYTSYILIALIYIAVSSSADKIRQFEFKMLAGVFLITFTIALFYFAVGFILGKNLKTKKTLSVSFGQKNTGLTLLISLLNFSPVASIPATIYIISHHLLSAILIFISGKISSKKEEEAVINQKTL
ncbi:MAG TPA: bile acid:sodium symporter [Spirochaetota bacterium]|nr:bile acid:sodium symporter [Spirochaetota bacterium]HOS34031.1 bile acid:sodium symporter [Spirochaetota bacterium]HOS56596.1 bile acid:sodium symporter [Spirochaetota bacterium]HPK61922.1 bile acid:sodium symporter [Spirochaetota bacterium]HQF78870.1 bile acid:sodium symporter [Spirochaetota bacterium]